MRPRASLAGSGAVFVLVLLLGAWPWQPVRHAFSSAFSSVGNLVLAHASFDGRVATRLQPLRLDKPIDPRASSSTRNVVPDTALQIHTGPFRPDVELELSLRRDVQLPWVLFSAIVLAAPLQRRKKWLGWAAGSVLIGAVGIASILLLLANVLSGRLTLVPDLAGHYQVSRIWGDILQFLLERWLLPPGNRVIAPLFLAAFVIALTWRPFESSRPRHPFAIPFLRCSRTSRTLSD